MVRSVSQSRSTGVTSYLKFYIAQNGKIAVNPSGDQEATINDVRLDDYFKHFVPSLKKITVFEQRPLLSNRKMRIPKKVKRANDFTFYGLWVYNDSPRGESPSDTDIEIHLKQYFEEYAL